MDAHAPRSGTEYLRTGARQAVADAAAARAIHEPLLAAARAGALRHQRPPGEALRAAYLLDRRGVDAFVGPLERLGRTFMKLAARMEELRQEFGLEEDNLNLSLGPLGRLL